MFDLVAFVNQHLSLDKLGLELYGWPPDVSASTWNWTVPDPDPLTHDHKMSWIGAQCAGDGPPRRHARRPPGGR